MFGFSVVPGRGGVFGAFVVPGRGGVFGAFVVVPGRGGVTSSCVVGNGGVIIVVDGDGGVTVRHLTTFFFPEHTLQLFLQDTFIYLGFLLHSPRDAQEAQYDE